MMKHKQRHVGPGKIVVSIYADEALHAEIKNRAHSLGLSVSKYVEQLARTDISRGGPMSIIPDNR